MVSDSTEAAPFSSYAATNDESIIPIQRISIPQAVTVAPFSSSPIPLQPMNSTTLLPSPSIVQSNALHSSQPIPKPDPEETSTKTIAKEPQRRKPREVIRIERDYADGDTIPQFYAGYTLEFEGKITPTEFQTSMNTLNSILASAHDPKNSILDNCLAILTFYISPVLLGTHYKRKMKLFDETLVRINKETFRPEHLNILSPRSNGFLFMEIEVY